MSLILRDSAFIDLHERISMTTSVKSDANRFTDTITLRCPPRVTALVDRAAEQKLMKPSEYVRRAVIERLAADGLDLNCATAA